MAQIKISELSTLSQELQNSDYVPVVHDGVTYKYTPFNYILKKNTAANWTSSNPVLHQGEEGLETDTGKRKTGDGVTAWNSLGYSLAPLSSTPSAGKVMVWESSPASWAVRNRYPVIANYTDNSSIVPVASYSLIQFDTKVQDQYNSVTTGSSWKFIAPYTSWYNITYSATAGAASTTSGYIIITPRLNGSQITTASIKRVFLSGSGTEFDGSVSLYITAGDALDIVSYASNNTNGNFTSRRIVIIEIP